MTGVLNLTIVGISLLAHPGEKWLGIRNPLKIVGIAMLPTATIIIPTKNRKDDLKRALASCMAQTVQVEIIVMDDGSTDDTAEMVRQEFPGVSLHRYAESAGPTTR